MIVKLILDQARILKDNAIDSIYGRRWLNEAMYTLSNKYDSACKSNTSTITCDDVKEEYDLPSGCRAVRKVTDSDGNIYSQYSIDLGKITFEDEDTYTIKYLSTPSNVLTDNEEPEIHQDYHLALSLYVASRELSRVNKTDTRARELLQEFYIETDSINSRLMNMKRRGKKMKAPLWS
jgi:hypothetical protein